jgi:hypothetical protein
MSQSVRGFERTGVAGEDLSEKQYFIVQLDASGDIEIGEGATDLLVGVLQNKPESGQAATYRFLGTSKVQAGGSVSIGDWVTSASDGEAVATTTDGDVVIGRALEAADAQDIFEVQLSIQHLYIA